MSLHLHLDPVGGIAGDMFVAAMLDAFPQLVETCWGDLSDAGLFEHVSVELTKVQSRGLAAQRFNVTKLPQAAKRTGNYKQLRTLLETGELNQRVKKRALDLLALLATAEAYVHGVGVDDVHFHEVADWDSVVDVVAAASILEHAAIKSVSCSALPMGAGLVKTEHGHLPVPAPATTYLLMECKVYDDGEPGERVTPTGAAIVKYFRNRGDLFNELKPAGRLITSGCGAGSRRLCNRPNVLRSLVIETGIGTDSLVQDRDEIIEIACDIDDMTPEELAVSLAHIRAERGVLDANYQVAYGKKGRILFKMSVLVKSQYEASIVQLLFKETSTLGLRLCYLQRKLLKRESMTLADSTGDLRVKTAQRPGVETSKIESDDLAATPGLYARRLRAQQALKRHEE